MAVSLAHIRNELLPGLLETRMLYSGIPAQWSALFEATEEAVTAPLLQVSLPAAVAMAAAAMLIKNPTVTRRFWSTS